MAGKNTVPRYTDATNLGVGKVSVANANRDGTGTIVDVLTPGTSGSSITWVRVVAQGATTAGMVRIYILDGATSTLVKEIAITAITASATVEAFTADWIPVKPLNLQTGQKLQASTEKAETFNVFAFGADY